jgi:L-fuculose-phosphate aldolase
MNIREDSADLRREIIDTACTLHRAGLNVNTAGNVSARCHAGRRAGFLITPSGVPYPALVADDLVFVDAAGAIVGKREPSSEWRMHEAIFAARSEVAAIVHTHSVHATALACQNQGIPAFHYMVAAAGGADIRCADYATFGTQELAEHALVALEDRMACLLAHHGVLACGPTLARATDLALEVEQLARTYLAARAIGEPPILSADEMKRVIERFRSYGPGAPA